MAPMSESAMSTGGATRGATIIQYLRVCPAAKWCKEIRANVKRIVNGTKQTKSESSSLQHAVLERGHVVLNDECAPYESPQDALLNTSSPESESCPKPEALTLLTLPQEVRDMIYEYVFQVTTSTTTLHGIRKQCRMLPPLLSEVCQQLRLETKNHERQGHADYWQHPNRTLPFWTSTQPIVPSDIGTKIQWTTIYSTTFNGRHRRLLYDVKVYPSHCIALVHTQSARRAGQQWNLMARVCFGDEVMSVIHDYCDDETDIDGYEQLAKDAFFSLQKVTPPLAMAEALDRDVKLGVHRVLCELFRAAAKVPGHGDEGRVRRHYILKSPDYIELKRNSWRLFHFRTWQSRRDSTLS